MLYLQGISCAVIRLARHRPCGCPSMLYLQWIGDMPYPAGLVPTLLPRLQQATGSDSARDNPFCGGDSLLHDIK